MSDREGGGVGPSSGLGPWRGRLHHLRQDAIVILRGKAPRLLVQSNIRHAALGTGQGQATRTKGQGIGAEEFAAPATEGGNVGIVFGGNAIQVGPAGNQTGRDAVRFAAQSPDYGSLGLSNRILHIVRYRTFLEKRA